MYICAVSLFYSFHSGAARTMTLEKNGARGGDLKPPEGKCKLHPSTAAVFQPQEEMTTVSQGDLNEDTIFYNLGMTLQLLPVDTGQPGKRVTSHRCPLLL